MIIRVKQVLYKDHINKHEGFHKKLNQEVQKESKVKT
jgi:hypothetical protein